MKHGIAFNLMWPAWNSIDKRWQTNTVTCIKHDLQRTFSVQSVPMNQNSDLKTYPGQASNQLDNAVPQKGKKESLGWSANENGIRSINELKFKFWLCRIETESTECEIEQNDSDLRGKEPCSVFPFKRKKTRVLGLHCFRGGHSHHIIRFKVNCERDKEWCCTPTETKTKTPQKKTVLEAETTQLLEDLVLLTNRNPHLGSEVTHLRPSAAYCHEVSMHVRGNSSWKRRDLAIFRKLPTPHLVMARSPSSRDCRWKYQRRCRSPSLSACVSGSQVVQKQVEILIAILCPLYEAFQTVLTIDPLHSRAVSPAWSIVWDQATCFGFPPPKLVRHKSGGTLQQSNEKPWAESFAPQAHFRPKPYIREYECQKARISAHRSQNIRQQIKSRTGNSVSPENSLRCYDLPGKTVPTAVPCNFACCLVL